MNILLIFFLLLTQVTYGAASDAPKVEDKEEQSVQLFRRKQNDAGISKIIARTLSLKEKDPFSNVPFRELRKSADGIKVPWIVCDFTAKRRENLLKLFKPSQVQDFFDPSALLRQSIRNKRPVDLTTFASLSETIVKEFEHRYPKKKLREFGIHIIDCENKVIGFIRSDDASSVQSYICSQLKYILRNDFDALKHMITMYHQNKFCAKGKETFFDRDMIGEGYIISWCNAYLVQHPADEEIQKILSVYEKCIPVVSRQSSFRNTL